MYPDWFLLHGVVLNSNFVKNQFDQFRNHDQNHLDKVLSENRMEGLDFSEVFYADDIVIFTETEESMGLLLHVIELEGRLYGQRLIKINVE